LDSHQHDQRARWPILAYRSVDWQPNDRLGRVRRQLFEHRREVLRGCANTHTNTDAYTDCNSDSYTYGNSNTYRDSNANPYTDADPMHGEMCTHTEAAPDSGTAPVACNVSWKR
jgi:hypothetical protein